MTHTITDEQLHQMACEYEAERARYVGGIAYYPANGDAFIGCMRKALAILDTIEKQPESAMYLYTPSQNIPYWPIPSTPVQQEEAYEGWRFICDNTGVLHHVPDHETLKKMCDLYYGAQQAEAELIEGKHRS